MANHIDNLKMCSVAKVDKEQTAKVADAVRPSVQRDSLTSVLGAQFAAAVGALDKAHEPRSLPGSGLR